MFTNKPGDTCGSQKKRKIMVELSEHTFQMLEVLAYSLARTEVKNGTMTHEEINEEIYNKVNDTFTPGVSKLLSNIADSLSAGVSRSSSWEREVLDSLTGFSGSIWPCMAGPLVKDQLEQVYTNSKEQ